MAPSAEKDTDERSAFHQHKWKAPPQDVPEDPRHCSHWGQVAWY